MFYKANQVLVDDFEHLLKQSSTTKHKALKNLNYEKQQI